MRSKRRNLAAASGDSASTALVQLNGPKSAGQKMDLPALQKAFVSTNPEEVTTAVSRAVPLPLRRRWPER